MIEFTRKMGPYVIREIWFSEDVYDVDGVDAVQFKNSSFSGEKERFVREASTTLVLDLTRSTEDIWNGMNRNCRHQINKTQNDNIIVRFNERIDEFFEMNRDFRKRRGLPATFISHEEISKNYFLFTYEIGGTLLGGHLCIMDDRQIRQLYSCSISDRESDISQSARGRGNRLAIWEAIKHAKQEGLVEYDFGGYATGKLGEELKGVNDFKLSFGGTICDRFSYSRNYSRSFDASRNLYLGVINTKEKIRAYTRRGAVKPRPEGPEEGRH
jgi:hypothetical protein